MARIKMTYLATYRNAGEITLKPVARFLSLYDALRYAQWLSENATGEVEIFQEGRSCGVYVKGAEYKRTY